MRDRYFQNYLKYHTKKTTANLEKPPVQLDPLALRQIFEQAHPKGFFARFEAFSPRGKYGRWLLQKPVVLKVNDDLFAHAGLSPVLQGQSLEHLNQTLKASLNDYLSLWHQLVSVNRLPPASVFRKRAESLLPASEDEVAQLKQLTDSLVFSYQSPTWYRGAIYCHPYYETESISNLLVQFQANRIFVGHTVTESRRVETRLGSRVFAMDTGMLSQVYGGKGNIVKIQNGQVEVFDSDGQSYRAAEAAHQSIDYPSQFSREELTAILEKAEISKIEQLNTGITRPFRVTFDVPEVKVRALFKKIDTDPRMEVHNSSDPVQQFADRYHFDIAAYRLSELLGFRLVPISVERRIDNAQGVVQYWVEGSYSEYTAEQKGWPYDGYCSYEAQQNLMRIFDLLISNKDRNSTNILIEQEQGQLVWIDHSRAFSSKWRLAKNIDKSNINITKEVRRALKTLNKENLRSVMQGLLNSNQIRAILRRRDRILDLDPE